MKRFLKICLPIILSLVIILGIAWYLFSYDKGITQDIFLSCGRFFANRGNMDIASTFYDWAYEQDYDRNAVAVELAEKYIENDNYTKAEVALNKAIQDGANTQVYIALSKTYVAQDKLYDAVELLDGVTDADVKKELEALRPPQPQSTEGEGPYNQLIDYPVEAFGNKLYVNPDGEYPSIRKHLYTGPISLKEGVNILYAVSVSDSGLVSSLKIMKPTVNGIIEPVIFQDSVMEAEIRSILNIPSGQTVYSNQLWDITEFTVPAGAQKYDDIRYMIHLESLIVENGVGGQICMIDNNLDSFQDTLKTLTVRKVPLSSEDIAYIAKLTNLESLTLQECSLSTSADFSPLTNLTFLDLSFNSIRNLSAVSSMPLLKELNMHRNALDDLSILADCAKLEKLDVSDNLLTTAAPIAALTTLTSLNVSSNKLTDISFVAAMYDLKEFNASSNQLADISPLAKCTKMENLNLSYNEVTDLQPLASHKSILYLDFSHNQVSRLPQWSADAAFIAIDGSYNKISDLTPLGVLQGINTISMDYNSDIRSVECLAQCPVLIEVNIYGTGVTDVSMLTTQSIIVNYNPLEVPQTPTEG